MIAMRNSLRVAVQIIVATWAMLTPSAHADSSLPARIQARASENGQFVVRVVPGKSMGDVYGYGGRPTGPFATAEWHRFDGMSYRKVHTSFLLNSIAPIDMELTNQGVLVTLDNWHNRGIGNILVIYAANGEVIRKYTLTDLYSPEDAKRFETSVSSTHWRCQGVSTALESDKELVIDDSIRGRFVVQLDTGAFKYLRQGGSCR
jgi:hypothetical protein